ncbi:glycosyltransferase [Candidatus Nitronereus thalassa]|uniref:Glycosyltransferase n=1 Tax=Candidatus Nitronereus thalassa TaxID=3020898 RepID=A0ABU3K554_9BACT|nr:glycosyltransferase [Candidatus Nitronereus thalassa]MDT7041521.1 glycosyltransferase [Candidatus Nitronereus thalassa]
MVSNLYPPYYQGGYEVRCAQVAEALHGEGHDVCVLTSTYGLPMPTFGNASEKLETINGVQIYRSLNQYHYKPQPKRLPGRLFDAKRHFFDAKKFQEIIASFQPDVVNWWSMYGLSKMLLPLPKEWGIPDVHWIEHWWMIREYGAKGENASEIWSGCWDGNWGPSIFRPFFRLAGRKLEKQFTKAGFPTREFPNCPKHVCFVSEHLRELYHEEGLVFPSTEVIHGGIPIEQFFHPLNGRDATPRRLRLLYAGQITPDRGLHSVLDALGLMDEKVRSNISLSIAGDNMSKYGREIKQQVEKLNLSRLVSFLGKVNHEKMPCVYQEHDVLVFPSLRDEGLPLTMVEAMLAGCAVVTTGSGGAMEIAKLANLPLFSKGDSRALRDILEKFVLDRKSLHEVALEGQAVAIKEFSLDRMIERWSTTLYRICQPLKKIATLPNPQ